LKIDTFSSLNLSFTSATEYNTNDYLLGVTVRIIDGAAIVNMRKPKLARTFGEHVDSNLIPFFISQVTDVCRCSEARHCVGPIFF